MATYNPKNERTKKAYFLYQSEARGKAPATVDAIRAALDRYESYTGHKDFASFTKEQAMGFKRYLARDRSARSGEPMAGSTVVATTNALREFFLWLSSQKGYKSRIVATDSAFLSLSDNERRAFKEPRLKTFPTLEQILSTIRAMPVESEIQRRDRIVLVTALLTGARDGALATLRLKHVDLERHVVVQDPREVRTKRRKRIDAFLFPLAPDLETEFCDWVRYLREVRLFGDDAPLLPRTRVVRGEDGGFETAGVEPIAWENSQPIREIFRTAFEANGLPYFKPHSFRDTLSQFAEQHAPTIEHFKAWSQNLGHDHVSTTLGSYGPINPHRQGELVRSMGGASMRDDPATRELFDQFLRLVRKNEKA